MLFVSGPHASGKTEVSKHLINHGFRCFDTGPIIRSLHRAQAPLLPFVKWIDKGEEYYGPDFTNQIICDAINYDLSITEDQSQYNDIAVIGCRTLRGIDYFSRNIIRLYDPKDYVIFIEADRELLYQRYLKRENLDGYSKEDFEKRLDNESASGLAEIKEYADITLVNDSSISSLSREILTNIALKQRTETTEGMFPEYRGRYVIA